MAVMASGHMAVATPPSKPGARSQAAKACAFKEVAGRHGTGLLRGRRAETLQPGGQGPSPEALHVQPRGGVTS